MTSLSSLLQQYHSELLAPLCHFLDACDLAQLAVCNSSFHRLLQNDILVWKQSFLHKWGQSRALNAAQHHNLLWRDAFAQLETLKSAALQGRWFEYEGVWIGNRYEYHFSLNVHCSQKLIAPTPCPPIPPEIQQKSAAVLDFEARRKEMMRQQVPNHNRPRILKEDVQWLPYPQSLLHWCLENDKPLQHGNDRFAWRGVEYYPTDLLVADNFNDAEFYERILDYHYSWLPSVPADVLYQLRHHHVYSHTKPQTGFVKAWDDDSDDGAAAAPDDNHDDDKNGDDGQHNSDGKNNGDDKNGEGSGNDGSRRAVKVEVDSALEEDKVDEHDAKADDCYVPVQGIIEWTMKKSGARWNDAEEGCTAQEFVAGHYNKKTRVLYLLGIARDIRGHRVIGCDCYKLHISEDGHSFQGKTCGNQRRWDNPICGATKCFRDNVIAIMEEEVKNVNISNFD
eukprot:TRINITY_DN2563_c0_g1_i2.p1 TRINITY_DN2563_c0_g1~~TRINITY_DN2563_c0_g1_i2.p1  ORF type:complete len:451 (+),score=79.67 TRINITY_DN2563_c0_g1_i2:95-1447(+)